MFGGGYDSVDEQEWQWMQQERNENNGEFANKLKVPNRMMKVHVSFLLFVRSLCYFDLNCLLVFSRWMVVMVKEILRFRNHTALVATADQIIHS
jgi:hypothetical protein